MQNFNVIERIRAVEQISPLLQVALIHGQWPEFLAVLSLPVLWIGESYWP